MKDLMQNRASQATAMPAPSAGPERGPVDKQQERSLACVWALRGALAYARERQAACERSRDRYKLEKPTEPYRHMSEQCAAHEARHIAEHLEQRLKEIDRDFRRRPPLLTDGAGAVMGEARHFRCAWFGRRNPPGAGWRLERDPENNRQFFLFIWVGGLALRFCNPAIGD